MEIVDVESDSFVVLDELPRSENNRHTKNVMLHLGVEAALVFNGLDLKRQNHLA